MRFSIIAALAACLFTFAAPAWAQPTSPSPGAQSPDPGVSSMDLLGYIRSLEAQIYQLERRVKGMPIGPSKTQLEQAIAALRTELDDHLAAKASQADLEKLVQRVTEIEATLAGQLGWYRDADGDGHGDGVGQLKIATTQPPGYVARGGDCNDGNANVNPASSEVVGDGLDNDCDANTSDVPPAQPARRIYGTVSLTGLVALHPGTYPADTLRNPDHGGAMVEIGFRVPLATGPNGYLNVCTTGGAGYATGHTVPWRVALGLCGGWRLFGADFGFAAEIGALGSITDANAVNQTGDYVGVVGGGFVEVSPTKAPVVLRAGLLAGGGNVRLATESGDESGPAPVFAPMAGLVVTY
jgi:hypothetical protein